MVNFHYGESLWIIYGVIRVCLTVILRGELEVLHYKNFGHHLYVSLIKIIFLYDTLLEVYIFLKKNYPNTILELFLINEYLLI